MHSPVLGINFVFHFVDLILISLIFIFLILHIPVHLFIITIFTICHAYFLLQAQNPPLPQIVPTTDCCTNQQTAFMDCRLFLTSQWLAFIGFSVLVTFYCNLKWLISCSGLPFIKYDWLTLISSWLLCDFSVISSISCCHCRSYCCCGAACGTSCGAPCQPWKIVSLSVQMSTGKTSSWVYIYFFILFSTFCSINWQYNYEYHSCIVTTEW